MWIIPFTLILVTFQPTQGALNEILDRCCTVGARLAESEDGCDSYQSVPLRDVGQGDQMSCRSIIEVCCLKKKHIDQCQRGKDDSINGRSCSIRSDAYGAEQYTECCQCCKLGLVAKTANLPCDLTSIGGPCDQVFKECCMGQNDQQLQPQDDIDECTRYANKLCEHECINTVGSFMCSCRAGYKLNEDGRSCKQLQKGSPCAVSNPCQQKCEDVGQTARCSCFAGYTLSVRDQRSCQDIDECSAGTAICPLGQVCLNTEGSYRCQRGVDTSCPAGFTYNPITRRCELNTSPQCPRGQMYNTVTRQCENNQNKQCPNGYALNVLNSKCEDINECARGYDNCVGEQRCENTIGSYTCRRIKGCGTGYTLDDRSQTCVDVDECAVGTHNCESGYDCRNLEGSFRCEVKTCSEGYRVNFSTGQCEVIVCAPGHRIDGTGNCVDINECIENPNICGSRTKRCINNIGSYQCQNLVNCPAGYELKGSGNQCEDIDECSRGTHSCLQTQECRNRPGTFLCQCPDGYESRGGPGGRCEDINECQRYSNQVCASNSECQNTQGSYRCVCKDGFQTGSDGRTCTDKDECQDQYRCEHECINNYGSYYCLCNDGYKLAADKRRCEDIDECNFYAGRGKLCIGKCTNIPGSYTCSCPDGYRMMGDQRTCQDIDECAEGTARCAPNAVCTNTRGVTSVQDINCPKGFYRASSFIGGKGSSVGVITDDELVCIRERCGVLDVDCIVNTTKSISWQHLTLPTVRFLPRPVTLVNVQTVGVSADPNLELNILEGNELGLFDVKTHKDRGALRLVRPLYGPARHLVKMRLDHRNTAGTFVMTSHLAYVIITVKGPRG
ncbi:fibulin-2-like isoform X2 [Liolophura sinensis]|uniref:fibulin-2-like isoform X2 n=1 Tax=Liolophura sinensis TaxID=3198878 RepID=UPI0031584D1A